MSCSKQIRIIDETLREGRQTAGVHFSDAGACEVAYALLDSGVDYIEIGHPYVSCKNPARNDFSLAQELAAHDYRERILGHAMANRENIDAVFEAGCGWVGIFHGVNENYLTARRKGAINYEQALQLINDSIGYAKSRGLLVRFSLEDAFRTPQHQIMETTQCAVSAGADRFCLADTVGFASPDKVFSLVTTVRSLIPADVADIECHFHNDFGLATANAIYAILAGADVIATTINNLGERAGITSLAELATVLTVKYPQFQHHVDVQRLSEISALVSKYSGIYPDSQRPIIGKHAFTHTAALHQEGAGINPSCVEPFEPAIVGRTRNLYFKRMYSIYELAGTPFMKEASELVGHRNGQGTRYVLLDNRVIPSASVYVICRKIEHAYEDSESHVDAHRHNCDSAFGIIGNKSDGTGLTVEVTIENETKIQHSPRTFFIPKGVLHSYRILGGSGIYWNLVLGADYNQSIM